MSDIRKCVLIGATGFTGRLVAGALREQGIELDIAGRSAERLGALRDELELPGRLIEVDLRRPEAFVRDLAARSVVLNCAGPFVITSRPLIEAIARRGDGLCYLDVSGEQQVVHDSRAGAHEAARERGATILHACAFESFIADILAHELLRGEAAPRSLDSYYWFSRMVVSPGTRLTMRLVDHLRTFAVDGGQLHPQPPGALSDVSRLGIAPGRELALFTPYPEVLFYHQSFAPDHAASHTLLTAGEARLFGRPGPAKAASSSIEEIVALHERAPRREPTPELRARQRCGVALSATTAEGAARLISFEGFDPYGLTAAIMAWACRWLIESEATPSGVLPPGEVFPASDFLSALPEWPSLFEGLTRREIEGVGAP